MSGRQMLLHPRAPRRASGGERRGESRRSPLPWVALALALPLLSGPARASSFLQWVTDGSALCKAAGNQQNPQIVADGEGGAIVTWQDRRVGSSDDIYAQHVRTDGSVDPNWPGNGVAVCTALLTQSNPQIATDGAGGAIVTWQDSRNGAPEIYAQHVLALGTVDPAWTANGVALSSGTGGGQGAPQIVSDGQGGAIVVWQDGRSGNQDIYAQRVRADGTLDPNWPAGGVGLCTNPRSQTAPQIVTDGAGGAITVWQDPRNGGISQDIYDIYAQRVLASGAIAPGWPANGSAICTAVSSQFDPQLVADGAGGAIVTWYDRRYGQPIDPIYQDIFVQKVNAAGVPQWTPDGVPVCLAPSTQTNPEIATDGAGGAIIVWQDVRGGNYDIYAQHVRSDSTMALPVGGIALCKAPGSQENPQLVPDGCGGAIVTWQDFRSGSDYDIYAIRMKSDGTIAPGWPADGLALCTAAFSQQNPRIAVDGTGGAIVTWQDLRSGGMNPTGDIYAQRVNDSPCMGVNASARSLLLAGCGAVSWTEPAGGRFFDAANWNLGAGPLPSDLCPTSCSPYDAGFGIGAATYDVDFGGSPTSGEVTVAAGDRATFQLGGNTYGMSALTVDGAGTALTIANGMAVVGHGVEVSPGAGSTATLDVAGGGGLVAGGLCVARSGAGTLTIEGGATVCTGSLRIGAQGRVSAGANTLMVAGAGCPIATPPGLHALAQGGAFADTLAIAAGGTVDRFALQPGGVLFSAAPIPFDVTNAGTLSPGSDVDSVASLALGASYTQASNGTLNVDLGGDTPGDGYDVLKVAGAATLAGILQWKLVRGYRPAIGKPFEVLVAHPRVGVFDSVAANIAVTYTDTSVVLIATATTPVLASLVSAEAEPGRVRVRWLVSGGAGAVTIFRAQGTRGWEAVASRFPDGTGWVEYEDTDVSPGRYGYRLGLPRAAGEAIAGEVWVEVPSASRFALTGVSPNPASGAVSVSFSLENAEPASLALFDLVGRRVSALPIASPRAGNRVLTLGAGRDLPPGVYWLQLSQGARFASSRVAVVR